MRVLIVKLSSMGDVIHTLPAICDANRHFDELKFDWVVEKGFAEIPSWFPTVTNVLPIQLRNWRKSPFAKDTRKQFRHFVQMLRAEEYDLIIDAQGLIKSSFVSAIARGKQVVGFDKHSAREGWASLLYSRKLACAYEQHAIDRIRKLFAYALGYEQPDLEQIDYGLQADSLPVSDSPYVIFFHGASADYKLWPVSKWQDLGQRMQQAGYKIYLPWGSENERQRAETIAASLDDTQVMVLPRMSLSELKELILQAAGIISVDTGLAHLSAALDKLNIVLYASTDPKKIGTKGANQYHLSMADLNSEQVFNIFSESLQKVSNA